MVWLCECRGVQVGERGGEGGGGGFWSYETIQVTWQTISRLCNYIVVSLEIKMSLHLSSMLGVVLLKHCPHLHFLLPQPLSDEMRMFILPSQFLYAPLTYVRLHHLKSMQQNKFWQLLTRSTRLQVASFCNGLMALMYSSSASSIWQLSKAYAPTWMRPSSLWTSFWVVTTLLNRSFASAASTF